MCADVFVVIVLILISSAALIRSGATTCVCVSVAGGDRPTLSVLCVSSRQAMEGEMEQMTAISALPSRAGCRKRVSFESLRASVYMCL